MARPVGVPMTRRVQDPAEEDGDEDEGDQSAGQGPEHGPKHIGPTRCPAHPGSSRLSPRAKTDPPRSPFTGCPQADKNDHSPERGRRPGDVVRYSDTIDRTSPCWTARGQFCPPRSCLAPADGTAGAGAAQACSATCSLADGIAQATCMRRS